MAIAHVLKERLAFTGIREDDVKLLGIIRPVIEKELPRLVSVFYDHMRGWPSLTQMFNGEKGMSSAAGAQVSHWKRLFSGSFDDAYFESVRRIGLIHSRIGLKPQWYIGGYAFVASQLLAAINTHYSRSLNQLRSRREAPQVIAAITKVIMLDMDLAISVYLEESEAEAKRQRTTIADDFESKVGELIANLATASAELESTAQSMSDTTQNAQQRSMTVAAAAEEASAGIQSVASTAVELANSITAIRQEVKRSADRTDKVSNDARRTDRIVRDLSNGADRIGEIVGLISQISDKTSVLALNATIEAARAGEAGRAFEIVASEVKGLAAQTASATEQIQSQIADIQTATREAVVAITAIAESVGEIVSISTSITQKMEEQTFATNDIKNNVEQTAQAARSVSSNVVNISEAADITSASAVQLFSAASGLARQADTLRSEVDRFADDIRAA